MGSIPIVGLEQVGHHGQLPCAMVRLMPPMGSQVVALSGGCATSVRQQSVNGDALVS